MKIRQVTAELFHSDGKTDMTKPRVIFRKCANAPKNAWKGTAIPRPRVTAPGFLFHHTMICTAYNFVR